MASRNWYKLDNVGVYFASLRNKKPQRVFRYSVSLKENVDKDILLHALKETIKIHPEFHVVLKPGLFWYYLEEARREPYVKEENKPVCHKIVYNAQDILYRISYFKKRINVEVSHILSDGRGTLDFLICIVDNYLKLKYNIDAPVVSDASQEEKSEDSFDKYYKDSEKYVSNNKNIYKHKGVKYNYRYRWMDIHLPMDKMKKVYKKYDCTLSSYLTSLLIYSITQEMKISEKKKTIKIHLPIDLRGFYNSKSNRNFFGVAAIEYTFTGEDTLEEIIKHVNNEFKNKINLESIEPRVNKMVNFQKWIAARLVPLVIKNIGLRVIDYFSSKHYTTTLSNVGKVDFGKEFEEYIEYVVAHQTNADFGLTLISNKNDLCISYVSKFKYNTIIKRIMDILKDEGIDIEINTTVV